METLETLGQLDARATRRRVVVAGAKLAYAAPLVAASFRLSTMNAEAAVSGGPTGGGAGGACTGTQITGIVGLGPNTIRFTGCGLLRVWRLDIYYQDRFANGSGGNGISGNWFTTQTETEIVASSSDIQAGGQTIVRTVATLDSAVGQRVEFFVTAAIPTA